MPKQVETTNYYNQMLSLHIVGWIGDEEGTSNKEQVVPTAWCRAECGFAKTCQIYVAILDEFLSSTSSVFTSSSLIIIDMLLSSSAWVNLLIDIIHLLQ